MGVPRNWAFPAARGPKTGGPAKKLSQTQAPTQACEAAAQVRSGVVHARRRTAQPQLRAAYSRLRLKQRVLRSEDRSAIWWGHFSPMTIALFFPGLSVFSRYARDLAR